MIDETRETNSACEQRMQMIILELVSSFVQVAFTLIQNGRLCFGWLPTQRTHAD